MQLSGYRTSALILVFLFSFFTCKGQVCASAEQGALTAVTGFLLLSGKAHPVYTGWKNVGTIRSFVGSPEAVVFHDLIFFNASDEETGAELWVSDGTAAGTRRLFDIYPGIEGSNPYGLTVFHNELFFVAEDAVYGYELRKIYYDTAQQRFRLALVKDIRVGPTDGWPAGVDSFMNRTPLLSLVDKLFFVADDGIDGMEVWQTDGTEHGTFVSADIHPGPDGSSPEYLTPYAGRLFFSADDGTSGQELWSLDYEYHLFGDYWSWTAHLRADIAPLAPGSHPSSTASFETPQRSLGQYLVFDSSLFFGADDGINGVELWKYRVSTDTYSMITNINASGDSIPIYGYNLNGALMFSAADQDPNDSNSSFDLWCTYGTPNDGQKLYDSDSGRTVRILGVFDQSLIFVDGYGYISNRDPETSQMKRLYWDDDTHTWQVVLLKDNLTLGMLIGTFTEANGKAYFPGRDSEHGDELWQLSNNAVSLVADIDPEPTKGRIVDRLVFNDSLYVFADNGEAIGLYKIDR